MGVFQEGKSPLHLACYNGYYETVKLLFDHGASVDLQDKVSGYYPHHCN